jgi:hypothetical protein
MAKTEEKEVAVVSSQAGQLPAFLQGQKKQASLGNIDKTDLIIPRVKLLQAISPEITESNLPGAKAGQFWHTLMGQPLGDRVRFVPIVIRKTIALWPPRNDTRGILARSADTVNWDKGYENLEFEIKPKGAPKAIKINTGPTVAESFVVGYEDGPSLDKFGSSVPGDPQSAPMASLTYNMMFYFPDFADLSPAIVINTRSSVKRARDLVSKIEMRPVDHFAQMYEMYTTDESGDEGPYKGYAYLAKGYVDDEAMYARTKELYEKFREQDWVANEETDDTSAGSGGGGGVKDSGTNKF